MAVTGIATLAYLSMVYGVGVVYIDHHPVYLALFANADSSDTFYVMLLNALCIASGAIGATNPDCAWPMFIFGMVTFGMFNQKLFGSMNAAAASLGPGVRGTYNTVAGGTMLLWCAYPIMYFACELTHSLSIEQEVTAYAILDVAAKCDRDVQPEAVRVDERGGGVAGPGSARDVQHGRGRHDAAVVRVPDHVLRVRADARAEP